MRGNFTLDDGRILSVVRRLESLPARTGAFVPLDDGAYVKLTRELLRRLEALGAAGRRKKDAVNVPPAALPMLASVFGKGNYPPPDKFRVIITPKIVGARQLATLATRAEI